MKHPWSATWGHFMQLRRFLWSPWLWLAGLAAVLSLHFWFPQISARPMNDTYSTERSGKKAFYLLTQWRFGERNVERNESSPNGLVSQPAENEYLRTSRMVCLLGPSRYPDKREWELLMDCVARGGVLVVAPRHSEPSMSIEEVGLKVEPLGGLDLDFGKILEEAQQAQQSDDGEGSNVTTALFGGGEVRWRSFGKVSGSGGEVLVEYEGEPQAVLKRYRAGKVLLIATDEIFSNGSLAYKDNGILALRLLEYASVPGEEVLFDEYFNTVGAPKIVGLLFDPLLRPLSVQLLVVLVVFTWCGSKRFGRMLPKHDVSRHDIADHTDALGNLYYRSKDGPAVVRLYYEQLRAELQLRFTSLKESGAIETLSRRAGQEPEQVRALLRETEVAMAAPKLKRRAAAEIIRRLAELRAGVKRRGV